MNPSCGRKILIWYNYDRYIIVPDQSLWQGIFGFSYHIKKRMPVHRRGGVRGSPPVSGAFTENGGRTVFGFFRGREDTAKKEGMPTIWATCIARFDLKQNEYKRKLRNLLGL